MTIPAAPTTIATSVPRSVTLFCEPSRIDAGGYSGYREMTAAQFRWARLLEAEWHSVDVWCGSQTCGAEG
jgi:hypothetical protein